MAAASEASILWNPSPERASASRLAAFWNEARRLSARPLENYEQLHRWSTEEPGPFWALVAANCGLRLRVPWTEVVDDAGRMPGARWFSGARLNFAENLLSRSDDAIALISVIEDQAARQMSFAELSRAARGFAAWLGQQGVRSGDVVAALMPNSSETVIAMLGATMIGAVFTSCSPDFGVQGVLDRFGQASPRVLVCSDGYFFKGQKIDIRQRCAEIIAALPSLQAVALVSVCGLDSGGSPSVRSVDFEQCCANSPLAAEDTPDFPFDHPVYIMYSSGTTGLPKCMVQGAGVLLNHLKEHQLHCDLRAGQRIFYYTTCGWMMWNWLVSALASGATLLLFDGNPFYPDPAILWRLAEQHRLSIFGTSARYLAALEQSGTNVAGEFRLHDLQCVLSTGSPLPPERFDFVYHSIKQDVQLSSISGGTDLNGCFALGNPMLPVRRGELQCLGLGMSVEIWDQNGQSVIEQQGELVCTRAFPSMPLHFINDPDGELYRRAYFDVYPGVWRHGDFAEITAHGGLRVSGRSDATLNPGGVRIGTADIYRVAESLAEVEDSVCIGQDWQNDVRVVLFVKLRNGLELNAQLEDRIRRQIRAELSPRHVPTIILQTPEIPYTRNLKKVEIAVRRAVMGLPIPNLEALANPQALLHFQNRPELQA
ncbi:MAG: acetoacetate--CoA ligase [Leptospirales bacterium]|nr:acetoacetate--CoA ligase [Leptospirales bacterium]